MPTSRQSSSCTAPWRVFPTTAPDPTTDPPNPQLLQELIDLASRYSVFRLLLAGHSHVNRVATIGPLTILATAAFGESPFEARQLRIEDDGHIHIETLCFAKILGLSPPYDPQCRFAQGRPSDRTCVLP